MHAEARNIVFPEPGIWERCLANENEKIKFDSLATARLRPGCYPNGARVSYNDCVQQENGVAGDDPAGSLVGCRKARS